MENRRRKQVIFLIETNIGLPRNKFYTSIFSFNVGVELGQIAIIILVYALLIIPFRNTSKFRKIIVYPLSIIIAAVAGYWTIVRLLNM